MGHSEHEPGMACRLFERDGNLARPAHVESRRKDDANGIPCGSPTRSVSAAAGLATIPDMMPAPQQGECAARTQPVLLLPVQCSKLMDRSVPREWSQGQRTKQYHDVARDGDHPREEYIATDVRPPMGDVTNKLDAARCDRTTVGSRDSVSCACASSATPRSSLLRGR